MSTQELSFIIVAVAVVSFLAGLFGSDDLRKRLTVVGEFNALGLFTVGLAVGVFLGVLL